MLLSEKYAVPENLALLYDFVNTVDLRHYVEKGRHLVEDDAFKTEADYYAWLATHELPEPKTSKEYLLAIELRDALRSYLKIEPEARKNTPHAIKALNNAARPSTLQISIDKKGKVSLIPTNETNVSGLVLAQFYGLATSGTLDRLKMCSSDSCQWIFYDRSKPSNRRWCSSTGCGNREKTSAYRARRKTK